MAMRLYMLEWKGSKPEFMESDKHLPALIAAPNRPAMLQTLAEELKRVFDERKAPGVPEVLTITLLPVCADLSASGVVADSCE